MTRLVVVDATAYGPEPSGAKRRAVEMLRRLPALLPQDVLEVHWARDGGGPPDGLKADNLVHAVVSVSCRGGWLRVRARAADLRRRRREAPFTHLLVDHGPLVRPDVVRNVVTLHDLRFLHGYGGFARRLYGRARYGRLLAKAARVVAVSPSVAAEARAAYGLDAGRVVVAPNAASDALRRPAADLVASALARLGVATPYVLVVSRDEPRKALGGAVAAWREGGRAGGASLVVVGAPSFRADGVLSLGHASDADLAALYTGARCLLAPSLYEGYDLPIVEALACGTPAIASLIPAHQDLAAAGARGLALVAPPRRAGGAWTWPEAAAALASAPMSGVATGSTTDAAPPAHSWDASAAVVAAALTDS